jgi:hypothetical protein
MRAGEPAVVRRDEGRETEEERRREERVSCGSRLGREKWDSATAIDQSVRKMQGVCVCVRACDHPLQISTRVVAMTPQVKHLPPGSDPVSQLSAGHPSTRVRVGKAVPCLAESSLLISFFPDWLLTVQCSCMHVHVMNLFKNSH